MTRAYFKVQWRRSVENIGVKGQKAYMAHGLGRGRVRWVTSSRRMGPENVWKILVKILHFGSFQVRKCYDLS